MTRDSRLEPEFDAAQLASQAGVTTRTIHYYVQQGLLRPAGSSGPGPKYNRGHLARLRLIKRLQREHLPLAEIARRLKPLSDEAVEQVLREAGTQPARGSSALEYVRSVLSKSDRRTRISQDLPALRESFEPLVLANRVAEPDAPAASDAGEPLVASMRSDAETRLWSRAVPASPAPPSSVAGDRSQWERITLADGIELHIRRPSSRSQQKALERLMTAAREIFQQDGE